MRSVSGRYFDALRAMADPAPDRTLVPPVSDLRTVRDPPETDPSGVPGRCGACGYLGEPVRHFQRTGHAVVLVVAGLLTDGVAALVYWILKRGDAICPRCGRSWEEGRRERSEALPGTPPDGDAGSMRSEPDEPSPRSPGWPVDAGAGRLPRTGSFRRVLGVLAALAGLTALAIGIVVMEAAWVLSGVSAGLLGAACYTWGRRVRKARRAALFESMQRRVLELAAVRGGRLTATDVAWDLGVTIPAADRLLFSMDDGLRVRSEVTSRGLLVFDFPEIRLAAWIRDEAGTGTPDRG